MVESVGIQSFDVSTAMFEKSTSEVQKVYVYLLKCNFAHSDLQCLDDPHLLIYLHVNLYVNLYVNMFSVCLSSLSIHPSINPSIYPILSIYPIQSNLIYLYVYLSNPIQSNLSIYHISVCVSGHISPWFFYAKNSPRSKWRPRRPPPAHASTSPAEATRLTVATLRSPFGIDENLMVPGQPNGF